MIKRVIDAPLRSLMLLLLLFCGLSDLDKAWSNPQAGLDWLATRAQVDGSFSAPSPIATPFQATSEAIRAFRTLGQDAHPAIAPARQFLATESFHNTEYLARKIMDGVEAEADVTALVEELLTHQNADAGFGDLPGYTSTALDTAFALQALSRVADVRLAAGFALGYLQNKQKADGGFHLHSSNASSVYVTALVSAAVQPYRLTFNVEATITQANQFLLQARGHDATWGTVWETALALLALVPATTDSSPPAGSQPAISWFLWTF